MHLAVLATSFVWCKKNNLTVGTLYLSNIPEWIFENGTREKQEAMVKHLKLFVNNNTWVIDANYPTSQKKGSGPPQRITQGQIPIFSKNKQSTPFLATVSGKFKQSKKRKIPALFEDKKAASERESPNKKCKY